MQNTITTTRRRTGRALGALTAGAAVAAGAFAATPAAAASTAPALHCQYLVTRPGAAVWSRPGAHRQFIKYKTVHDGVIGLDRCDTVVRADGNAYVRVRLGADGTAWMARNMLNRGLTRPPSDLNSWLNTPRANTYWSHFRTVGPAPGTDYGRITTWKRTGGAVYLYEDRVTVHYDPHSPSRRSNAGYTNYNHRLRRYRLASNATIQVDDLNYTRLTGRPAYFEGLRRISRLRFLYGYVTAAHHAYDRVVCEDTGYRLFFNAAHDTITKIQAIAIPGT